MVSPDSAVPTRDEAPAAAAPAMLVDGRTVRSAGTHDVVDPGTGWVFATAPRGRDAVFAQVKDGVHAYSTARMGAEDDPGAVVDPQCRVRGLDNFRVVDASIMPKVVSANIHPTVIATAERAVGLLRGRPPRTVPS
ncbi:GMC oxidoreductase [Saccharomonospora cyanea]|uniref:GMC oxidoreductase n=1 Tax=Saccharomonospora cyanea TaxID=40989 RepID=UPI0002F293AF|nr:GMC oxidoreductase [Saccharomonospora cyanea]